jgi:hypothetical protein
VRDDNQKQLGRLRKLMPRVLRRLEVLLSEDSGPCEITEELRKEVKYEQTRTEQRGRR